MAINKIDWPTASTPSYTPSISTDYNAQNENMEELAKTTSEINLTNWDTGSTAPTVDAGSVIEAFGSQYSVTSSETISTSGASTGTLYLVFDASTPEFVWTDTLPVWSSAYRGYYDGDNRFTGHQCTWDGSTSFTEKLRWISDSKNGDAAKYGPDVFSVEGTLDVGALDSNWTGTYSTQSILNGASWVPSSGIYMMTGDNTGNTFGVQISSDGGTTWYPASGQLTSPAGLVVSDGTNYRILNNSGATRTVYHRKI